TWSCSATIFSRLSLKRSAMWWMSTRSWAARWVTAVIAHHRHLSNTKCYCVAQNAGLLCRQVAYESGTPGTARRLCHLCLVRVGLPARLQPGVNAGLVLLASLRS